MSKNIIIKNVEMSTSNSRPWVYAPKGIVFGHPRFLDGTEVRTAPINVFDEIRMTFDTTSGSTYIIESFKTPDELEKFRQYQVDNQVF